MSGTDWLDDWDALVTAGSAAAVEEFFLARLEEGCADPAPFVEALRQLRAANKKTVAATLLELAAEQALAEKAWEARKVFLREVLRLGIGEAESARKGLEECVRKLWSGRPSLERLLVHFAIGSARKPLEALDDLELWLAHDVGGVFLMAGRGPGRVVEASPQLGVLRLDFEKERRVPVPIEAAVKHLEPLPDGHFLRRRLDERAVLAAEVAADPARGLEAILTSFGGAIAASRIRWALDGVLPDERWSAWWAKAKKHPRLVTIGSGTKLEYRLAAGEDAGDLIREEFLAADLAGRVELARRHGARNRELAALMAAELVGGAAAATTRPALAWEALTMAARLGGDVAAARRALLGAVGAERLLVTLDDAPQREAVLDAATDLPAAERVALVAGHVARESNARLLSRLAAELLGVGEGLRVEKALDHAFLHPTRSPALFVWALEPSADAALNRLFVPRWTGAQLVRLIELAERKEMVPLRPRLREVLSARGVAAAIVQDKLTLDQGRRVLQLLEHPGELAEERRWIRRAITARFAELRESRGEGAIPALEETVHRLQDELRGLLEKGIPETLKAIQIAREHGDLSENFEYHAARARQELLSARAAQLQGDLAKVRVVDPAKIDASRVRVGTRLRLEPEGGGEPRVVTVLGPYEAEPERGILSHGTEAVQPMLDKAVGDRVPFEGRTWVIAAIERATSAPEA